MNHLFCGIDIAKSTAVFCLLGSDGKQLSRPETFANSSQGFKQALKWMRKLAKPYKPFDYHVCMEATGVYYLPMAKFFHGQDAVTVSVANPAQVKSYAQAELVRTKTDGVDSAVIARFAMAMKPRLWTPPLPHEEEVLSILRRLDDLKDMKTAEGNRLEALQVVGDTTLNVQAGVSDLIVFIDSQMDSLKKRLRELTREHPDLDENIKLLCSIPGVAEITAHHLLSEIGDIERFDNVKQVVAYAGLAPAERQSGTSVRGKSMINKRGSAKLRTPLYMPAISAMKHNPVVKDLYERLRADGKPKMLALVACMRKLLHIAYGVLKNRKRFDPAWSRAVSA